MPSQDAPQPPVPSRTTVPHPARLAVLVSGTGSNLAALLAAQSEPGYPARVVAVISDKPDAGGLEIARAAGVATVVVRPADFPDRGAWDAALARAVDAVDPAWVVCAGFMRILGPAFLGRYAGRVLNTHPALLPSFPGAHAVRDALAHRVAVTGCTLHLVDEGVDTGPILAQRAVDVLPDDDEASLHERIKVAERAMLVEAVAQVARHGVRVEGRRARIGG